MSNQIETSIKTITNMRIYDRRLTIDERIVMARAAQENLAVINKSLEDDKKALTTLMFTIDSNENDVFNLPINTSLNQSVQEMADSYCILLARVLLSSSSPEFSNSIRERFFSSSIINLATNQPTNADNVKVMHAKFVNLLEIHGPVKGKSLWLSFWTGFKNMFKAKELTA